MLEPIWSWDPDRKEWHAQFSITVAEKFFLPENVTAYLSMIDDQLTIVRDRLRATAHIHEAKHESPRNLYARVRDVTGTSFDTDGED